MTCLLSASTKGREFDALVGCLLDHIKKIANTSETTLHRALKTKELEVLDAPLSYN